MRQTEKLSPPLPADSSHALDATSAPGTPPPQSSLPPHQHLPHRIGLPPSPARGFLCMAACLKIPNRARNARMQGRVEVQLTPWHSHPPILPPSSNRPKVQITTFSTPHNRHRTIVGNRGEKVGKGRLTLSESFTVPHSRAKGFKKGKYN